jgi:hypothetical protein
MRFILGVLFCIACVQTTYGQSAATDTLPKKPEEDLTFYYFQMFKKYEDSLQQNRVQFEGCVDAYYGWYSDSLGPGAIQKFPTSAPKHNTIGLNMAMIAARFNNGKIRSNLAIHYGDIPATAWSGQFNFLQEANAGIRLSKNIWFDAGFFRTHIGFESIQPRENIASSIAATTYFEPYYLSGAKLTFQLSSKLTFQLNAFNGFNTFEENNSNKAVGFSLNYEIAPNAFISWNNITCNEAPDGALKQTRIYSNLYGGYKAKKFDLAVEGNYGYQQHSNLTNSNNPAHMSSGLIAIKWKPASIPVYPYLRGEIFEDSNEILTGPVENALHQLVGINMMGITTGIEWKPYTKSYFRIEHRYLKAEKSEDIFRTNGRFTTVRQEVLCTMGCWF